MDVQVTTVYAACDYLNNIRSNLWLSRKEARDLRRDAMLSRKRKRQKAYRRRKFKQQQLKLQEEKKQQQQQQNDL